MSEQSDTCAAETHDPQRDYIRHLEHELKMLTNAGVIESMVRNKSVNERISSLERELSEVTRERQRERVSRYGRIRASGSDHTTACSIWGDDGQGHTKENYPEPLPCNCGALENFYREKSVAAERERDELRGKQLVTEDMVKAAARVLNTSSLRWNGWADLHWCPLVRDMLIAALATR